MSSEEDLATQSLLFPKGALIKGVEYRERAGLPGPRYNAKTIYAALKAPLFHGGARSIEAFHKTSTFSSRIEFFARPHSCHRNSQSHRFRFFVGRVRTALRGLSRIEYGPSELGPFSFVIPA
jgi:hypothetical protein